MPDEVDEFTMLQQTCPELQKPVARLMELRADEIVRRRKDAWDKARWDEASRIKSAKAEGKVEGKAEVAAKMRQEGLPASVIAIVSEIVNLKVSDIDSGNMQALIERGKGKKDRYVNLPESILEGLRSYYKEYRPGKYLFEGQGDGKYSIRSVQNVFKSAMRKANINKKVGIHGLRHSFATHLLENGTDINYIQQLLGHNDIKTIMTYARVARKNLKNVKNSLDSL
jgi:integrase